MNWTVRYADEPAHTAIDIEAETARDAAAKRVALTNGENPFSGTETREVLVSPENSDKELSFTANIQVK